MRGKFVVAALMLAPALGFFPGIVPTLEAQGPEPVRQQASLTAHLVKPPARPFDTSMVRMLDVPAGFRVQVFAANLGNPRMMAVGDDSTLYVTRRDSGDVLALSDGDRNGSAETVRKVVTGLAGVHGIALHAGWMYLATVNEVYVAEMAEDGTVGRPRVLVGDLPDGGQHPNRTLAFGPDSMLYVTVGSTCNVCTETSDESAAILRIAPDGSRRGVHSRGLRNTIGFGWHPATQEMWGFDNGADWRGDDAPPEELNLLQGTTDYGWPFCFGDRKPDDLFSLSPEGKTREEYCQGTAAPVLTYTAHSAPMQMAFYTGAQFPAEYQGDAFLAFRGSWNRMVPSGYKVVRVRFENGKPTRIEDFMTGFLTGGRGQEAFIGRPVGIAVAPDGSLLVGDDSNGVIYRVSASAPGSTR